MGISAGLGIANLPFKHSRDFWRWVDLCEAGGVDSLWQSDRIINKEANLDCMSLMAALAGRTERLKFGMNVASLGLRDPILLAKACASIDFLSDGRLLPAFGIGTARSPDFAATGTPTKGRGIRTSEGLNIISRLWAEDSVSFTGKFYQLTDASIAPKPVQRPMPLWVGGSAARAVERTARYGTGWQAGLQTPSEVAPVVTNIKAALKTSGRSIAEDHYGAGFSFRFGSPDEAICQRHKRYLEKYLNKTSTGLFVAGNVEDILELVDQFHRVGIHKFILRPLAVDEDDMMEQTRLFIDKLLPAMPGQ